MKNRGYMRGPSSLALIGAAALLGAACGGATPPTPPAQAPAAPPLLALRAGTGAAARAAPPTRCARRRPGEGALPAAPVRQSSPIALVRLGDRTLAYVADEDEGAVHTLDLDARSELALTPLAGAPSHLLVLADGRVAVTLREGNQVMILEPAASPGAPLEERCAVAVAVEPVALAVTPDDQRLLVTSGYGHALTALAEADLRPIFTVDLPREPRAVIASDDGRRAFIAHVVGGALSIVDLGDAASRAPRSLDLRVGRRVGGVPRVPGGPTPREGGQGFALARLDAGAAGSPLGVGVARLFAPMVSIDPGEPKSTSGYGGANEWSAPPAAPLVSVIDTASEKPLGTPEVPGRHSDDCLLPRAAVVSAEGTLLVSCLGIDAVLELDARAVDPLRVERRRFHVPAGPTGIALDPRGHRVAVWSAFAHEAALVDLAGGPTLRLPLARRAGSPMNAELARGRVLFHAAFDPRISRDGRACASCHPDGREDGLTWSTPNGPRQTILLAGRVAGSAPYGWFGKNGSLEEHVTHSLERLGGQGLTLPEHRADFAALLAYVAALRGPSRAGAAVDPARAQLAELGRTLFNDERQGCATCHLDGGTDRLAHDVQSGNPDEISLRFDTPSLRFVGDSAPYFHDGRYGTLDELLRKCDGTMGHTAQLGAEERRALEVYLESL
jgi:DNA-binding beta-propeller fold protein YncE